MLPGHRCHGSLPGLLHSLLLHSLRLPSLRLNRRLSDWCLPEGRLRHSLGQLRLERLWRPGLLREASLLRQGSLLLPLGSAEPLLNRVWHGNLRAHAVGRRESARLAAIVARYAVASEAVEGTRLGVGGGIAVPGQGR